ncbi:MAG TPA: NAD(P)-binding domain-containing protein [archaeon]|nr:NAD(P)-binding domain-containing protein [archaeon]
MTKKIGIIGSGDVGKALARGFKKHELKMMGVGTLVLWFKS